MSRNSMDVLREGRRQLKQAGIDGFALDALVLLAFTLKKPKEWLFSHDYTLTEKEKRQYMSSVEKRAGGAPVAYIVGSREFMGLTFSVNENVLIPRSDTEILAEKLIDASRKINNPKILDLCTGSGCIAISAAYYNEEAEITAADISAEAIEAARTNALTAGVSSRITFCRSDLFETLENNMRNNVQTERFFDIIVSNPPYISLEEMPALPREVMREPRTALLAGKTGLEFYEKITARAGEHLKKGGLLLFEIGRAQAESVVEIMNKNGYNYISIYKDLAGLDRVVKGEYDV